MLTKIMQSLKPRDDAELVSASLAGDRSAFEQVVSRYQRLICSLAYSATGSVPQSEDLAQETFVAAWKSLAQLREPAKLRSWLCGIVRHRISQALGRQSREPSHAAESLETAGEAPSPEPLPSERAISRDEEAILWRSLERIPETYREPLVLFYREHKSIEHVAVALELSEDTVKQRLSRGRKLLQEEIAAFVEGALEQTAPDQTFTANVMSALPATLAASGGSFGLAAVKAGAAKLSLWISKLLLPIVIPAIGVASTRVGQKVQLASAESPREREFVAKYSGIQWLVTGLFCLTLAAAIIGERIVGRTHPVLAVSAVLGTLVFYAVVIIAAGRWAKRIRTRIRAEEAAKRPADGAGAAQAKAWYYQPFEYRSRATLLGLPLAHVLIAARTPGRMPPPARGWIAIGNRAYGVLLAFGGAAVGAVSVGGAAVGIIAIGGMGAGLFSFAAFALGWWSIGEFAAGNLACGHAALGWLAAQGRYALAHSCAMGRSAFALHANDLIARSLISKSIFFRYASALWKYGSMVIWAPVMLQTWQMARVRHAAAASIPPAKNSPADRL